MANTSIKEAFERFWSHVVAKVGTVTEEAKTYTDMHSDNKSNPHEVTKSQVGLGNVPNVTTNNQTPTYSDTYSLTTLSSGETLSTAFSKIKLAITRLIEHTSSSSNPHNVTKAQIGLENVPNVSTNNQTPTYSDASTLDTLQSGESLSTAFSKIKLAITKLIDHISSYSNPHSVTKSQVGLGNVPNVTTNNQTPTYSDVYYLETLQSGEALSTAFSKIKLAITTLLNHTSNTSNPHSVTKSQIGLGNVNNTSDAEKPISTAMQTALNGKSNTNHTHYYAGSSTSGGSATSAEKLANSRSIQINLQSTSAGYFDGSSNVAPGVTGKLPVTNGGTGASTPEEALEHLGVADYVTTSSSVNGGLCLWEKTSNGFLRYHGKSSFNLSTWASTTSGHYTATVNITYTDPPASFKSGTIRAIATLEASGGTTWVSGCIATSSGVTISLASLANRAMTASVNFIIEGLCA